MAITLKVIKAKSFQIDGVNHNHFTCAYKGRVFGVSSLRFDDQAVLIHDTTAKTLKIDTDVEVLKRTDTDQLTGETKAYLDIVPKIDILLADF